MDRASEMLRMNVHENNKREIYIYIYIYKVVTTKEFSEGKVLNIVNVEL